MSEKTARKKSLTVEEKISFIKEVIKKEGNNSFYVIVNKDRTPRNLFFRKGLFIKFMLDNENYKKFTDEELKALCFDVNDYVEIKKEVKKEKKTPGERLEEFTKEIKEEILTEEFQKGKEELNIPDLDKQILEVLDNEENKKHFIKVFENLDIILSLINNKNNLNILQIPVELQQQRSCVTSFRISKEVLKRFNKFCLAHKRYAKVDYLNYALTKLMDDVEKRED